MAYQATHEIPPQAPRMRWPLVLMLSSVLVSVILIAVLMMMNDTPAAGNIHSP